MITELIAFAVGVAHVAFGVSALRRRRAARLQLTGMAATAALLAVLLLALNKTHSAVIAAGAAGAYGAFLSDPPRGRDERAAPGQVLRAGSHQDR